LQGQAGESISSIEARPGSRREKLGIGFVDEPSILSTSGMQLVLGT